MMHQPRRGPPRFERLTQRLHRQLGLQCRPQPPADDASRIGIQHHGLLGEPLRVDHPPLHVASKTAVDQEFRVTPPSSDKLAAAMKPIARHMEETGIGVDQLVTATGFDGTLVRAIAKGAYTPSPLQRQRLAAALGVSTDDISWGHAVPVEYMRGNGPQSGRST